MANVKETVKTKVNGAKEGATKFSEKHPKITNALKNIGWMALGALAIVAGDKAVGAIVDKRSGDADAFDDDIVDVEAKDLSDN